MAHLRWLGAVALAGSFGCSGSSFSSALDASASEPDASAGGPEGSSPADAPFASDAIYAPDAPQSSDAGAGEAGSNDAGCVKGTVNFEIQAAPGTTTTYCLGAPGSCSSNWLGIRPAGGTAFGIAMPCETNCIACQPIACTNLCAAATRLADGGAQSGWDGTYFASSTCGAGTACVSEACAPAGNYVASFCGYAAPADAGSFACVGSSSTPTCTEVPFTWPPPAGSPPVLGVIGRSAADAGACCPVGWDLSSCTYPDGGSGQQCHNPAMGCTSSTTCGQGCDSIVTGRCDGG